MKIAILVTWSNSHAIMQMDKTVSIADIITASPAYYILPIVGNLHTSVISEEELLKDYVVIETLDNLRIIEAI